MVAIGLVAVSCDGRNTVMLVRSVITLLAAGATKSLLPTGLALSGSVSFNLKRKIIMGEYIDLALLLVNSQTAAAENQKLVFMKGELLVQQKQHQKFLNM
jgi:hypothetical protein